MEKEKYIYTATIAEIIDGDTLDLNIDIGFRIVFQVRIRLKNINTPEKNQLGYKEASEFWNSYLTKKLVIETFKTHTNKNIADKYGRYIADVYYDNLKLNDELVKLGLAVVKNY